MKLLFHPSRTYTICMRTEGLISYYGLRFKTSEKKTSLDKEFVEGRVCAVSLCLHHQHGAWYMEVTQQGVCSMTEWFCPQVTLLLQLNYTSLCVLIHLPVSQHTHGF